VRCPRSGNAAAGDSRGGAVPAASPCSDCVEELRASRPALAAVARTTGRGSPPKASPCSGGEALVAVEQDGSRAAEQDGRRAAEQDGQRIELRWSESSSGGANRSHSDLTPAELDSSPPELDLRRGCSIRWWVSSTGRRGCLI
jgi:hypothetical protein